MKTMFKQIWEMIVCRIVPGDEYESRPSSIQLASHTLRLRLFSHKTGLYCRGDLPIGNQIR